MKMPMEVPFRYADTPIELHITADWHIVVCRKKIVYNALTMIILYVTL